VVDNDSLDQVEQLLAALWPNDVPPTLRATVLAATRRELQAARWDRRLARAAILLLMVGLGLNVAIGLRPIQLSKSKLPGVAASSSQQQLVDTAIVIAEATDAATGSRFARQLATMSGHTLTRDEAAEIDAAVNREAKHATNGNRG
jgi:hypothetical protein